MLSYTPMNLQHLFIILQVTCDDIPQNSIDHITTIMPRQAAECNRLNGAPILIFIGLTKRHVKVLFLNILFR